MSRTPHLRQISTEALEVVALRLVRAESRERYMGSHDPADACRTRYEQIRAALDERHSLRIWRLENATVFSLVPSAELLAGVKAAERVLKVLA